MSRLDPTCGLPHDVLLVLRPFLPSEAFANVHSATTYAHESWNEMISDVASLEQASHNHTNKGGAYKITGVHVHGHETTRLGSHIGAPKPPHFDFQECHQRGVLALMSRVIPTGPFAIAQGVCW